MTDLQSILIFVAAAQRGGFAAAARHLGVAPSTVAKSVARLEAHWRVRLFHRTTRTVRLTTDGMRLFERCRQLLAEFDDLASQPAAATDTMCALAGVVSVDVPVVLGREMVLPVLASLAREHEALTFDIRLSDGYVDLVREGVDLAVRIGELPDSSLVARRIGQQDWVLCASPDYLRRHAAPASLPELAAQRGLVFRMPSTGAALQWRIRSAGEVQGVQPRTSHLFNEGDSLTHACLLGMGVAQLPHYFVAEHLASGRLVELLPDSRPPPTPIHIVVPHKSLLPARVRVVLDRLSSGIALG